MTEFDGTYYYSAGWLLISCMRVIYAGLCVVALMALFPRLNGTDKWDKSWFKYVVLFGVMALFLFSVGE